MTETLTADLGRFVAELRYGDLPDAALRTVRLGFTDLVGCMIAGRSEAAPTTLQGVLRPGPGPATLYFSGLSASLAEAVWINGTAAHALDYDDARLRGHVSAALVPAILAVAETLGRSGREMTTAYAAGYETWAELVRRDAGQHHVKGWHPTGIFGPIAAAAACASLMRLDAATATMALALGASHGSGLLANFGTMTKPYHAGRAGHSGLVAAQLAAAGMTASSDALEHPQGFLAAVSPRGEVDVLTPCAAGREWRLVSEGLNIKKYPVCYCAHRALDAVLDLLETDPITADAVESVVVRISDRNAGVLRNHRPRTGLEGKFSIEFAMACALIKGRAGLLEVSDAFIGQPDVQAMMERVSVDPAPVDDPLTGYAAFDQVTIRTRDGRTAVSAAVTDARGATEAPLGAGELWDKFEDCLAAGQFAGDARGLFEALSEVDRLANVDGLPGLARRERAMA